MADEKKQPTVSELADVLIQDFDDQRSAMLSVLCQVLENQAKYAASIACQGLTPDQVRELKQELLTRK